MLDLISDIATIVTVVIVLTFLPLFFYFHKQQVKSQDAEIRLLERQKEELKDQLERKSLSSIAKLAEDAEKLAERASSKANDLETRLQEVERKLEIADQIHGYRMGDDHQTDELKKAQKNRQARD